MCPEELVLFISTLAIAIAKDKSTDEINLLSVIFSQLGDTLATIATCRGNMEENQEKNDSNTNNCNAPSTNCNPSCCEPSTCCDPSN